MTRLSRVIKSAVLSEAASQNHQASSFDNETLSCFHCGAHLLPAQLISGAIQGQQQHFCCVGCMAASQAIHAINGAAVQKVTEVAVLPDAPAALSHPKPAAVGGNRPSPAITPTKASFIAAQVRVEVSGVTCSGCMSVIDKVLHDLPGVQTVQTNLATRQVHIGYLAQINQVEDLLAAIRSKGYGAAVTESHDAEAGRKAEKRAALWRLFVALFAMMQVMMYAYPAYVALEGDLSDGDAQLMRYASLVLTVPVMLFSARPFFTGAWRDLSMRRIGMDVPVALGIGVAFIASTYATITLQGDVYFDSITMFVAFLLTGRYVEMLARARAQREIEQLSYTSTQTAHWLPDYPAQLTQDVLAGDLKTGQFALVRMGEAMPADGVVVVGAGQVDEALLTGEAHAVSVTPGSRLLAGSVNLGQNLIMQVQAVGGATQLSTIKRLLLDAAGKRPAMVALADRYASRFLLAMIVLAVLAGGYWMQTSWQQGLQVFIAVLIITCPCALSLATPITYTVAAGQLAKQGVLLLKPGALETLAKVNHILLDKTGTLTQGKLGLQKVDVLLGASQYGLSQTQLIELAAALEQQAVHPVAQALQRVGEKPQNPVASFVIEQRQEVQGRGIIAHVAGLGQVRLGSQSLIAEDCPAVSQQGLPETGQIEIWLACDTHVLARFVFSDTVRPEAKTVITQLQQAHYELSMATGDRPEAAQALGHQLGLSHIAAALLPQQKMAHLAAMQQRGLIVAMVGDGINDGPVLAQADVAISFAHGAPLAHSASDLVLIQEDLTRLPMILAVARRARYLVNQNLLWALMYNLFSVPAAAAGWITPAWAGIGMAVSSLLVVLNSLRLLYPDKNSLAIRQATRRP